MVRNLSFLFVILVFPLSFAAGQTGTTAPAVRFLAPNSGEQINNNFVTVKYELLSPVSAAGTPTFQLRLDTRDPVRTTDTQYTFTGLSPGTHTVTVQVVDANDTPISGLQNQVQFTILPQNLGAPSRGPSGLIERSSAALQPVALSWQEPNSAANPSQPANPSKRDEQLPKAGSTLPLLSVIGMGVLVGGIASALRTRQSSRSR